MVCAGGATQAIFDKFNLCMGLACGGILEVIGIVSNSSFDLMLAMELK